MFMNFMDYVDDGCMLMFTNDQATRVRACLNTIRVQLKNSNGCIPLNIEELESNNQIQIYPNPVDNNNITINFNSSAIKDLNLSLYNSTGQQVFTKDYSNYQSSKLTMALPKLKSGIYIMYINNYSTTTIQKIVILNNNKGE